MVPCRVIYLFGQGKGAQARGWTDEGGTLGGGGHREGGTEIFEGGTCPPLLTPLSCREIMLDRYHSGLYRSHCT